MLSPGDFRKHWHAASRLPVRPLFLSLSLLAHGKSLAIEPLVAAPVNVAAPALIYPAAPTQTDPARAPLSLQHALREAAQNMAELSAARQEQAASSAQLQQAQSRPNPELSYSLEDWRGTNQSRSLQFSLALETGNKRKLRIAAAEAGQAQADKEFQQSWLDSRTLVSQAYFDALLAQRQRDLAEAALELAKRFTLSVQQRINAGKLAAAEVHKARLAENSVQLELLEASQKNQLARQQLQSLIGRKEWTELDETGLDLPDLAPLSTLSQALEKSSRLQKAQWEVQKRTSLADLERSKTLPDLTLSLGLKQSRDSASQQVLLGFALPLPLFDRNSGNIAEAQHRAQKAVAELQLMRRQLHSELQQNHTRYLNLQQQAQLLNAQMLPDATQAYQAARLGFSHGKFSLLDVLDAQRSLLTQQALYFKTLAEGHRLYFELQRLGSSDSAPDLY